MAPADAAVAAALGQVAAPGDRLLVAGAPTGDAAGGAVVTEVLLDALEAAPSGLLTHRVSVTPGLRTERRGGQVRLELGVQPVLVQSEAFVGGWLHRRQLRSFAGGWAVFSRYAGALLAANVPYVIWEATTFGDELRASDPAAHRRSGRGTGLGARLHTALLPVGERVERTLYSNARVVLAMSEYTRDRIVRLHGLPSGRVGVLSPPPTRAFRTALEVRRRQPAAARETGYDRLLSIGRLTDPRKNVPLLLSAFDAVRARNPRATLTLIGPYTEAWRREMAPALRDDAVTLAGRVTNDALVEAYCSHDLLVVTSRQEGYGLTVAEALYAGLPVVCTRCGGPEHLIRGSGAGVLVEHDAGDIANAVSALLDDAPRRASMGARGLEYAEHDLSFATFRARVAAITADLLLFSNAR